MCARHIAGSHTSSANTSTIQSTSPATTIVIARSPGASRPAGAARYRTRNAIAARSSARTTRRSRSQSVSRILCSGPAVGVHPAGLLVVRVRLVPHPARCPNGNAATTYTADRDRRRQRPRRARAGASSSTIRPAITTAGTDSALIDTAAPAASPMQTAVREARVVAVAERDRHRQHRQRERRAVGVHRHRHPEDRPAGGDQARREQRVRARA